MKSSLDQNSEVLKTGFLLESPGTFKKYQYIEPTHRDYNFVGQK